MVDNTFRVRYSSEVLIYQRFVGCDRKRFRFFWQGARVFSIGHFLTDHVPDKVELSGGADASFYRDSPPMGRMIEEPDRESFGDG